VSIDDSFQKTCEYVEKNTLKINQSILLKLYSYYKQATKGDVMGERPRKMDFMGRAKFDGWSSLVGMSAEEAKENYVRIGRELDFVDPSKPSFEEKHAAAKEMLDRELDVAEYEEIKSLWKAHSIAEDNRDIDGLMATL
ncbi:uncharacterized protein METZ01_LOCUS255288, partial [marine metagenome]